MARSGDALGYYYEEGYIEEGYYVYEPYIVEDYIAEGYFLEDAIIEDASAILGSSATVSIEIGKLQDADANLDVVTTQTTSAGRIQQGSADFGALFTPSVVVVATKNSTAILDTFASFLTTVSPIRDNDVTLNNIVNLSSQGDRTRSYDSALSASFEQSSTANQIKGFTANFTTSTATLAVVPGTLQSGSANFTSDTTLETETGFVIDPGTVEFDSATNFVASPISYVAKTYNFGRPYDFNYNTNTSFVTNRKYGSHALSVTGFAAHDFTQDGPRLPTIPANTDFSFGCWFRVQDNTGTVTDTLQFTEVLRLYEGSTELLSIEIDNNTQAQVRAYYNDGTGPDLIQGEDISYQTWHHAVIQRTNGAIRFYLDGVDLNGANPKNYSGSIHSSPEDDAIISIQPLQRIEELYVDEVYYKIGDGAVYGYNSAVVNDDDTVVLYHFDNTYEDDTRELVDASISLTANATLEANVGATLDATVLYASSGTLTVNANQIFDNSVSLNSEFTQTATTGFIKDASTDFDSIASQISVVNKIGNTLVAIDTSATLTADVNEIVQLNSDLSTNFAQSADVNAQFDANSALDTTATISADASGGFIGLFNQELDAETALTADNLRVRFAEATLVSSNAAMTVDAVKITDITESYASAFTQPDVAFTRFRDTTTDFDSIATQINIVNKIGQGLIGLDVVFSQTASGVIIAQGGILLESVASQDTVAVKTVQPDVDLLASTDLSATGTTNKLLEADPFASTATMTVDAVKITELVTEFESIVTQSAIAIERTRDFNSNLNSVVEQTVDASRVRTFDATTYPSFAGITADAGILADARADLGALFTPTLDYRVLHLQQYVYVVPSENRTYILNSENRSFTIDRETRTYTVGD